MNGDDKRRKEKAPSAAKMLGDALRDLLPYTNLPYQLIGAILVFFGIGYGLDAWMETYPTLTIVFSLFGVGLGLYSFVKSAIELSNRKSTRKNTTSQRHPDDTQ